MTLGQKQRKTTPMIKEQLIRDEGDIPYAYQDSLGYWTIGVGFLIDWRKGGRIPDAVRDFWLEYEINKITNELEKRLPFFSSLSQVRKDTLINMAFNLGVNGLLNFKKTIALMADGKHAEAALEMLDSAWARQVKDRAQRLSQQWREDRYV